MKNINLQNVIWKEGKYYVAQCLNVDVSSFGKTRKEASENLEEALALYFEDMPRNQVAQVERPQRETRNSCRHVSFYSSAVAVGDG